MCTDCIMQVQQHSQHNSTCETCCTQNKQHKCSQNIKWFGLRNSSIEKTQLDSSHYPTLSELQLLSYSNRSPLLLRFYFPKISFPSLDLLSGVPGVVLSRYDCRTSLEIMDMRGERRSRRETSTELTATPSFFEANKLLSFLSSSTWRNKHGVRR